MLPVNAPPRRPDPDLGVRGQRDEQDRDLRTQ